MAIAIIAEVPGGDVQLDEQISGHAGVSPSTPPPGALARMGGPTSNGWRVISVWESEAAWEAFRRDRLEPAFRQAGREMPSIQVWQLDSFFTAPQSR
jgi:hypothetical protein